MRNTRIMIAAAALFAATQIAGVAQARTVNITTFKDQTISPTATANGGTGYITGTGSAGLTGKFKVRDAKTGKLVVEGQTNAAGGTKGNYQTGKVELNPGHYTLETWQVDGHGNPYKGESKVTVKNYTGSQGVATQVEAQTPSQVTMDQARATKDKIDTLRGLHKKTLDAAGKSKNETSFRLAVESAQRINDKIKELEDQYDDQRAEAARQHKAEQSAKTKKKVAEQQSRANTANKAHRVQVAQNHIKATQPRRPRICLH